MHVSTTSNSENSSAQKPFDVLSPQDAGWALPQIATGEYAAELARFGWAVFPCLLSAKSGGKPGFSKPPATANGFHDASKNPNEILRLWRDSPGSLIGIATGKRSGVIVLDVDSYKGEEAQKWLEDNAAYFNGVYSYKTVSGGRHFMFTYPDVESLANYPEGIKCSAGKIAPGIDVRADGGYACYYPANGLEVFGGEIKPLPHELLKLLLDLEPRLIDGALTKRTHHTNIGPFDNLSENLKRNMVTTCLQLIGEAQPTMPRDEWRNLGFACADAEARGAPGAFDMFREWSKARSDYDGAASDQDMSNFERDFDPTMGTSVGTLIGKAAATSAGKTAINAIWNEGGAFKPSLEAAQKAFRAAPLTDADIQESSIVKSDDEWQPRYRMLEDIKPDETPHLIDGVLREGTIGLLYGPSYVGKTILAAGMAYAISCGKRVLGRDCQQGGVFIVESEGVELVADNLRAYHLKDGVNVAGSPIGISGEFLDLLDKRSVAATLKDIRDFAKRTGNCSLVIVDTFSQSIAGHDENAQATASAALKQITLLGRRVGAAVLIIHHNGKDQSAGARGSNVLTAGVHTVIELSRQADGHIKAAYQKFKGGQPPPPDYFRIEEVPLRIDGKGRVVGAAIAVHDTDGTATAAAQLEKLKPAERAILTILSPGGEIISLDDLRLRFKTEFDCSGIKTSSVNTKFSRALGTLIKEKLIFDLGDGKQFQLPIRQLNSCFKGVFGPVPGEKSCTPLVVH